MTLFTARYIELACASRRLVWRGHPVREAQSPELKVSPERDPTSLEAGKAGTADSEARTLGNAPDEALAHVVLAGP